MLPEQEVDSIDHRVYPIFGREPYLEMRSPEEVFGMQRVIVNIDNIDPIDGSISTSPIICYGEWDQNVVEQGGLFFFNRVYNCLGYLIARDKFLKPYEGE